MEKKVFLLTAMLTLSILLTLNFVSAINLQVTIVPVSDTVVTEFKEPAVFNMSIKNLGNSDNFLIYSIVGVDMYPNEPIDISSGETKNIELKAMPSDSVLARKSSYVFEYLIKDSEGEIQNEKLTVGILDLKDAVEVKVSDVSPFSTSVNVTVKNNIMTNMDGSFEIRSQLLDDDENFSLNQFESKVFSVPIQRDKIRFLSAGDYVANVNLDVNGKSTVEEVPVKFVEEENIQSSESSSGFFIRDYTFSRENVGNVKKTVTVDAEKNIISYLFTTFDVKPTETVMNGFSVRYNWQEDLLPGQILKVTMTTNWFYPILIVVFIVVVVYLVIIFIEPDLRLRKNVSFVNTRGGEFALKVTIRAKAKKHLDKIKVVDTLPHLVYLYEKYGAIAPDKVETNRLEWNLETLQAGEEKIFSYIVYSKVGIIGKFELPNAKASFELNGKSKRINSNKAVFMS